MGRPDHRALGILLEQALSLPSNARDAFLHEACGTDVDLRAELESLISAHDEASGYYHCAWAGLFPVHSIVAAIGRRGSLWEM